MTVIFKGRTLQDKLDLFPSVPIAFDDEGAEDYFCAAGWADKTDKEPMATYPVGSVNVDPLAVHAESGKHVQPELAAIVISAQIAGTSVDTSSKGN